MAALLRVGDHARPENSAYRVARGDELLQDTLFAPRNIRRGLDMLAAYGEAGGFSGLAYTPEMLHRFEEVLERRYNTTDGAYAFAMPHFAPYVWGLQKASKDHLWQKPRQATASEANVDDEEDEFNEKNRSDDDNDDNDENENENNEN